MKRRQLLKALGAGAVISAADWLGYFRRFGVPGTKKDLGLAESVAEAASDPHFLIYWFQEGGWDGYSMFNPVDTRNDATLMIPNGTLMPNPSWSDQVYRPRGYHTAPNDPPKTQGNLTYGFLAQGGLSLFPDLAVISSHEGNEFHSGGRWDYHYGAYPHSLSDFRQPDERTVMQAFCEAYGASVLMPHISWHRWLSDGELSVANFPEGTGYYEKLGPPYAHTIYGTTPSQMRTTLGQISQLTANARDNRIRAFVDNLQRNFLNDKHSESVTAFASAVQIHKSLVGANLSAINPKAMFTDSALRAAFNVQPGDEDTTATSVNGNPARSKGSPNTNVQALMAYEMMTKGLSIGFLIESREIRGFDTHFGRGDAFNNQGQVNQLDNMNKNLWQPLTALVAKLKSTQYGSSGKSYWDYTNIVLCSEMGRMMNADASTILASSDSDASKYTQIMAQDVCQHWHVSSAAFLGGNVQGDRQWGRVGSQTMSPIPIRSDGSLDPAFDPVTGVQTPGSTPDPKAFIPDAGHIYATALHLSGLDPDALRAQGKGRNVSPALKFVAKSG